MNYYVVNDLLVDFGQTCFKILNSLGEITIQGGVSLIDVSSVDVNV